MAGLLKNKSERGPRRSDPYTITERGKEELRSALNPKRANRQSWLARRDTFHSAPRALFFSWLHSEQESGEKYVNWAVEELEKRSRDKEDDAKRYLRDIERQIQSVTPEADLSDDPVIATAYRWMETVADAVLLKAQITTLRTVASIVSELPVAAQPCGQFLQAIQSHSRQLDSGLDVRIALMSEPMQSILTQTSEGPISGPSGNYIALHSPQQTFVQSSQRPISIQSKNSSKRPHPLGTVK
jgi:DNA-binding PadR family transcriptional regulator